MSKTRGLEILDKFHREHKVTVPVSDVLYQKWHFPAHLHIREKTLCSPKHGTFRDVVALKASQEKPSEVRFRALSARSSRRRTNLNTRLGLFSACQLALCGSLCSAETQSLYWNIVISFFFLSCWWCFCDGSLPKKGYEWLSSNRNYWGGIHQTSAPLLYKTFQKNVYCWRIVFTLLALFYPPLKKKTIF